MHLLNKSRIPISFRSRKKGNRQENETVMSTENSSFQDWTPITPKGKDAELVEEQRDTPVTAATVDLTFESQTNHLQRSPVDLDETIGSASGSEDASVRETDAFSDKAVLPRGTTVRPRRKESESVKPQAAGFSEKSILSDLSNTSPDCSYEGDSFQAAETPLDVSNQTIESLDWAIFVDERSTTPFTVPSAKPEAPAASSKEKPVVETSIQADASPETPTATTADIFVEDNVILSTPEGFTNFSPVPQDPLATPFSVDYSALLAKDEEFFLGAAAKNETASGESPKKEDKQEIQTVVIDRQVVYDEDANRKKGSIITCVAPVTPGQRTDTEVVYNDADHKRGSVITVVSPVSPNASSEEGKPVQGHKAATQPSSIKTSSRRAASQKPKEERLRDMYYKYFSSSVKPPPPKKVLINEDIKVRLFHRSEEEWKVFHAKNKKKGLLREDRRGYSDPVAAVDDSASRLVHFWQEQSRLMEHGLESLTRNVQDALSANGDSESVADSLNLCSSSDAAADHSLVPEFMSSFDESAFDTSSFKSLDEIRGRCLNCVTPSQDDEINDIGIAMPRGTPIGSGKATKVPKQVNLDQSHDDSVWGSVLTQETTEMGFYAEFIKEDDADDDFEVDKDSKPKQTPPVSVSPELAESIQQPFLEESAAKDGQGNPVRRVDCDPPAVLPKFRSQTADSDSNQDRKPTASPTSIVQLEHALLKTPDVLSPSKYEELLRERRNNLSKTRRS